MGVAVAVQVAEDVGVAVCVGVDVRVAVAVQVGSGVHVGSGVQVGKVVHVGTGVQVGRAVQVARGARVGPGVWMGVGVLEGVGESVGHGVGVGVSIASALPTRGRGVGVTHHIAVLTSSLLNENPTTADPMGKRATSNPRTLSSGSDSDAIGPAKCPSDTTFKLKEGPK